MINLLPDGTKKQLRAARLNVTLSYYIIVLIFAALFLALLVFGSLFLLDQTKKSAEALIEANGNQASAYSSTQEQLNQLHNGLDLSKTILSSEVRYSRLLPAIGQLMPQGTIIDSLTLNEDAFMQPVELKIYASSTDLATQVRDNFQASSIFSQVNVQNVSDSDDSLDGYPVTSTLTVIFNRGAAQ